MNDKKPKSRDRWEKAQIVSQIVSGVVLAGIAVVLSIGSSQISASIQKGQFLSGVIDDLTSTDNRGQRDIALIALDRFLGNSETELVAEVAEQVIRNSDFDSVESQIAFKILEQRSNARAQQLLDEIAQAAREAKIVTEEPKEIQQTPALQKAQIHITKAMGRIGGNLVYIQFSDEAHRNVIENLAKKLRDAGYRVPGIEMLDFEKNDVRYFYTDDRQTANDVAEIVETFLNIKLKVNDLTESKFRASKGQVEVWICSLESQK